MLVLFDLDNTLGDRANAMRSWAESFAAAERLPTAEVDWILEIDRDGYRDRFEAFALIRERFELDTPVDQLVEAYRSEIVELTEEVPGATACLRAIKDMGHGLAIVTNGSSGQQHAKIDRLGFRDLVDAVAVSGDLSFAKPDPRIFEEASRATGLPLAGGWMIGDAAVNDCVGAAALGMATAWLARGRTWPAEHEPPTVVLDQLSELLPLLRRTP